LPPRTRSDTPDFPALRHHGGPRERLFYVLGVAGRGPLAPVLPTFANAARDVFSTDASHRAMAGPAIEPL